MALISPTSNFNFSNPRFFRRKTIQTHDFNLFPLKSLLQTPPPHSNSISNRGISPFTTATTTTPISTSETRISSSFRFLEEDVGTPWEGAVLYKRDPSVTHIEYCTTLESLGLEKLSSELSKSRASSIGLRVTKGVKYFPQGTPVQISIDVTRKRKKLKLDGIVKTVITLCCNRCAETTTECVFSNFTLLLHDEPIEEPDTIDMGTIFGDNRFKSYSENGDEEDNEDIDLDDQLYFPAEAKEIDISKNIRDLVHVEITLNAICDPTCKGLCLKCGVNLNKSCCNCGKPEVNAKEKVLTET